MNAKLQLGKARVAASDSSSNPRPRKKLRRTASTKLIGQNENIWGDIIGAGFANEVAESNHAQPGPNTERPKPFIQAAKSFASETTFSETMDHRPPPEIPAKVPEGFLEGCYFYIHGFTSKQVSSSSSNYLEPY